MVSFLHIFLQTCFKSGPHFIPALKIVHRSPGSHNKVIYVNSFVLFLQVKPSLKVAEHARTYAIQSGPPLGYRL